MKYALMIALMLVTTGTAWGHAEFVNADPAPGEAVAQAQDITITFSESVDAATIFLLRGATEYPVQVTDIDPQRYTVQGRIQNTLDPGVYQVVWTVTSEDEHPITGSYSFEVSEERGGFPLALMAALVGVGIIGGVMAVYITNRNHARPDAA